jgi:hypothetical protein
MSINLRDFFNFNSICPLCDNPLTLYLQLLDSICFKATLTDENTYVFRPFQCIDEKFKNEFIVIEYSDKLNVIFSSKAFKEKCIKHQLYFYYLCNDKGIQPINSYSNVEFDYEINLYNGCYFRTTPTLCMQNSNVIFKCLDEHHSKLLNSNVACCLKNIKNNTEHIYMINLDFECENIIFWCYTCNEEQAVQEDYSPNIFEKTLPFPKKQIVIDKKHALQLMKKIDNWVIMS